VTGVRAVSQGKPWPHFDLDEHVRTWNRNRDKTLPYFLFINIYDPHDPYRVREVNPWIPETSSRDEAEFIQSRYTIPSSLCDGVPQADHLAILRGLYLGDVASADAQVARLLAILDETDDAPSRVTIVTADHGEHLGENRLMGHQFTVRNAALHIPMIITGLPGLEPAVIERPVELRQVHRSIRCWALGESCPASLPTSNTTNDLESEALEPIFAIYSDSVARLPRSVVSQFGLPEPEKLSDVGRTKCSQEDPVFGDLVSMIRYPMKITWFERSDPVLHDLSWDAAERSNLMKIQPEVAAALLDELEEFVRVNIREHQPLDHPELSEDALRTLKSLGYIE
jgi:hypothetical protein